MRKNDDSTLTSRFGGDISSHTTTTDELGKLDFSRELGPKGGVSLPAPPFLFLESGI